MKDVNYKQIKQVTNLPKYDLGKINTNGAGFQLDFGTTIQGTVNDSGADLSGMASGERNARVAGITSNALKLGTGLVSKLPTSAAIEASKSGLISQGTGGLGKASGAMKSIAGMGIATGLLGAGMGTMDVINSKKQMNNAFSGNEIQSWTGSQTGYGIGNNPYELKTLDAANATNVINQRLKTANTGLATGSASIGSGLGTAVGSGLALAGVGAGTAAGAWLGPIGALGGALIGGLTGWLVGGKRRREQEKAALEELARQEVGISNFNTQSLSEANSLGMRLEYETKHNKLIGNNTLTAAYGKQPFDPKWEGQNGWAHNGEYLFRPSTLEGKKITNGTGHAENARVSTHSEDIIYTDKFISPTTGMNLAASAEAAHSNIKNNIMPEKNMLLLNLLAQEQLMYLNEQQTLLNMNRKDKSLLVRYAMGKMPKYNPGKNSESSENDMYNGGATEEMGEVVVKPEQKQQDKEDKRIVDQRLHQVRNSWFPLALLGSTYMANMGTALSQLMQDRKKTPRRYNPYVPSGAAETFASIAKPVKDYTAIAAINNATRQAYYNNRHLAPGQRMLANDSIARGMMNSKASAYNDIDKNYYSHLADYANKLASFKANDAQLWQSGNRDMDESFNKQLSKINDYKRSDVGALIGNTNDLAKNFINMYFGNRAYSKYDENNFMVG